MPGASLRYFSAHVITKSRNQIVDAVQRHTILDLSASLLAGALSSSLTAVPFLRPFPKLDGLFLFSVEVYSLWTQARLEADVELESIAPPFRKSIDTELSIEVIDVWPTSVGQLCVFCIIIYALCVAFKNQF